MTILTFIWAASQAASLGAAPSTDVEGLKQAIEANSAFIEQYIECMEKGSKDALMSRFQDATPDIVVDEAQKSCSPIAEQIRSATFAAYLPVMSAESAKNASDKVMNEVISNTRREFVKTVDGWMATEGFAELRFKHMTNVWVTCIRDKASAWSKLTDEASSVATAAVASCRPMQAEWKQTVRYNLRAQGVPVSLAEDIEKNNVAKMQENAVGWVIEERAKTLSN